jgi:multiple antibiotic resistance protein
MGPADFAINFFVALFALIDPIGNVPLFAAATAGTTRSGRRLTAVYISIFAFAFLTFFFATGLALLRFFGISMPAFRIAGGILLLLLGLDMARGDLLHTVADSEREAAELSPHSRALAQFERLIVPFGMPLLIGPGAISSAVIYAEEARAFGPTGWALGVAVIGAICLMIVAAFWFTDVISRALGRVGAAVVIRVLGLILCAMAVQFMLIGLRDSTVNLVRRDTAAPYQSDRRHPTPGLFTPALARPSAPH